MQRSLKVKQKISLNEETDRDVALTLQNVGNCLNDLYEYNASINFCQKTLAMKQNISRNAEAHRDVALFIFKRGECFSALSQCVKALQYFQRSFLIHENAKVATPLHCIDLCEIELEL